METTAIRRNEKKNKWFQLAIVQQNNMHKNA